MNPTAPNGGRSAGRRHEELLLAIRLRFYVLRPADYRRDRPRLLHALTWPPPGWTSAA